MPAPDPLLSFRNPLKQRLAQDKLSVGFGLRQARTTDTAVIAKSCGFHWLFIDTEHTSLTIEAVAQIAPAAISAGIAPIVRVPGHESFHCARALDAGALGVIVPHIDTPAQACAVVDACRFPPFGSRSYGGVGPQVGFAPLSSADATDVLNHETLVIVMLETELGIDNAEAIAAVEGIDGILIGSNDLTLTIGVPGQFLHKRLEDAYEKMIAACAKHGKFPGMGGIYEHAIMEKYIRMGARLVLGGSDLSFIQKAGKERMAFLNGLLPEA